MAITSNMARWFSNYDNRNSMGSRLRVKRIASLPDMIRQVFARQGRVSIIDLGGRKNYWNILPRDFLVEHKVSITIVNLPGDITPEDHGPFSFAEADCCDLSCFDEDSFDIAHSNSVIEHVGDWVRMFQFATELDRVSQRYFVQTPNFWFPVEPHFMTPFFHWLPISMRIWLVQRFQLGHRPRAASIDEAVRRVESVRLLNRKMYQALFPDAEILTERILGLPRSLIPVKTAKTRTAGYRVDDRGDGSRQVAVPDAFHPLPRPPAVGSGQPTRHRLTHYRASADLSLPRDRCT